MFGIGKDPGTLVEISGDGGIAPAMSIDADFTIAIQVIQQDIIARELVLIGRHILAVHYQIGVSVSGGFALRILKITEYLIISAILFNDVENVLYRARLTDPIGNDRFTGYRSVL